MNTDRFYNKQFIYTEDIIIWKDQLFWKLDKSIVVTVNSVSRKFPASFSERDLLKLNDFSEIL